MYKSTIDGKVLYREEGISCLIREFYFCFPDDSYIRDLRHVEERSRRFEGEWRSGRLKSARGGARGGRRRGKRASVHPRWGLCP